jgi:hypothetical protein
VDRQRERREWLKAAAIEGAVVTPLLVLLGFFYLLPASTELLRGHASVMVGDGGDSVTNPWQYRLVLDVFRARPQDLLFGAIYTDQMNAPEGVASFIPWIERGFVLLFAPFMQPDLMPTAMVWGLMVLSGLCFHAYGRALGWPRVVAFALAMAWAFCPFTRARSVVHIALVGTYWAPLAFLALHVLARPPRWLTTRQATVLAAGLMLLAAFAAHYFVMMAAMMTPLFLLYYFVVLPRGASRSGGMAKLVATALPAVLFVAWSIAVPAPSYGTRALSAVVTLRSESNLYLKNYGAHPLDFVAGDTALGERDLLPLRARLTRELRVLVPDNRHERANGIRWSVLGACVGLGLVLGARRLRRRLSRMERILGTFAFVLGASAFLLSLSPDGLRLYDQDLGPIQLVAKVLPRFRVPNRIGILVHFAALLGAGVLLSRVLRKHLVLRREGAALSKTALALSVVVPAIVLLDYAPLERVPLAAVIPQRVDLEAHAPGPRDGAKPATCGGGITVPYVTWGFHEEDYYKTITAVRGTSCKVLHASYLTSEDDVLRVALGKPRYDAPDRARAERLARCAGASWILFRLDAPTDVRRDLCAEMGWSMEGSDICRAPEPAPPPSALRPLRECLGALQ